MSSVAFMASIFFENNTFWIAFHILVWIFSGFQHYFSSTLVRIALVFRFFDRNYARFFRTSRNFFWLVCRNCTLRAHGIIFMGSIFFEKNTFPNVFQILGGNFPGFRHYFSSTVTRTALVSRFLIGFLPIISDITQISIGWSVGTALYVSTGSFSWEAPSLKTKHFSNYISHFGLRLFRFSAKFFQHGSQNCIGF